MANVHTACVVVHRVNRSTDQVEFLVMRYQSTSPLSGMLTEPDIRFMSGTNKAYPHESPEETAVRKLHEETGLKACRIERIAREFAGYNHWKYGFLVNIRDCSGELRLVESEINGDMMSAPFWKPITQLDYLLSPVHQWLYDAAWEEVCAAA